MSADPKDFSFLTADERCYVALTRLDRLHEYLWGMIIIDEHLRSIRNFSAFDEDTDKRAEAAARTIMELIANILIVEVCGIWERFDAASVSIPTILNALDHSEVLSLLDRKYEQRQASNPFEVAAPPQPDFLPSKAIFDCITNSKAIEKSSALKKSRNYRHKYVAHPILATREERMEKRTIDHPSEEEVHSLISAATGIVQTIYAALRGKFYNYTAIKNASAGQSDCLYAGLAFSLERMRARLHAAQASQHQVLSPDPA